MSPTELTLALATVRHETRLIAAAPASPPELAVDTQLRAKAATRQVVDEMRAHAKSATHPVADPKRDAGTFEPYHRRVAWGHPKPCLQCGQMFARLDQHRCRKGRG